MSREWRPVKGLEDRYEVSNDGLVRTKPRILKPWAIPSGHLHVSLGKHRRAYVHKLVAEAFLPEDAARERVNHKNGDPTDNRVSNLERCTPGENLLHGYRVNGRLAPACREVEATHLDGRFAFREPSAAHAARRVGRTKGSVSGAIRRKGTCAGYRWKYVDAG